MGLANKILKNGEKVINSLENSKAPFIYFILTFVFIIILRNMIEIYSDSSSLNLLRSMHYSMFFLCVALTFMLLLYVGTKTDLLKIAKVVLPAFVIILVAPILDLILSLGKGNDMTYLLPGVHDGLFIKFLTFFGNTSGITLGLKTELALILTGVFIYFMVKNQKSTKGLLFAFFSYVILFMYAAIPFVFGPIVFFLKSTPNIINDKIYLNLYVLLALIIGSLLVFIKRNGVVKALIKDMRLLRITHYLFMFLLGVAVGVHRFGLVVAQEHVFSFIFIPLAIIFGILFSKVTNDLADYTIDKISNANRPLVTKSISHSTYKKLRWPLLLLSLTFAILASFDAFFFIALLIGNYFIYSMPPLRLKRIPYFSKLIITLNSIAMILLGFVTIGGTQLEFPPSIILFFIIFFTAAVNFIDIKDYDGDKRAGIKTLPTLLGLKKSKLLIGGFFTISYLAAYCFLKELIFLPFLIFFGIIQFYFINKKQYNEQYVLITYLISILLLLLFI